jgi:hypothetical protein
MLAPLPDDAFQAPPSVWVLWRERLRRRALRSIKRLVRPGWMKRLARQNLESRESLLDPAGPVVSLTTFGARLQGVFYTLESIGAGTLKPSRLVLWLEHELIEQGLPETLQRLRKRGLEVCGTEDYGPHKKYLPQVMSEPHPTRPLVTADDDVLYPRDWLAGLMRAHERLPEAIVCFRAHRIAFDAQGQLLPYAQWPACEDTRPDHRHFLTGVSGVLYPVRMQLALRERGLAFQSCCPRADDIWLNATALRTGVPVAQITPVGRTFFEIPGTRSNGLARGNVQGGGNDAQLRATFTPEELERLRQP